MLEVSKPVMNSSGEQEVGRETLSRMESWEQTGQSDTNSLTSLAMFLYQKCDWKTLRVSTPPAVLKHRKASIALWLNGEREVDGGKEKPEEQLLLADLHDPVLNL